MAQPTFRRRMPPGVAFYTTALVISLFAVYSILKTTLTSPNAQHGSIYPRDLSIQDEECRLVHRSTDQCAFVRANCPDEEAGLFSYLQLYYCSLAKAKSVAFTILVVWISLLFSTIGIAASDFLSINLSTISSILGMSESLAGVTFLAFGNGSPDVFSTFAAMRSNSGSLAIGELMGAAGFITAVVAGSMALVKPFKVAKRSFVRDILFFAVAASFSLVFLADGNLRWWECAAMVAYYVFYVIFVVCWHWWIQRRRRIRLSEHTARSHHHIPNQQELDMPEFVDDDEARPTSERTSLLEEASLETSIGTPAWKEQDLDDEEDDDDARNRTLAELASNMRVSRQERGERRNTVTPIRPSLIGALEFRSILSNLERRSTYSRPINLRRYSDDPASDTLSDHGHGHRHVSHSAVIGEGATRQGNRFLSPRSSGRIRAVSANDANSLGIGRDLINFEDEPSQSAHLHEDSAVSDSNTPRLFLSPTVMTPSSGGSSPATLRPVSNGLLAPPNDGLLNPNFHLTRTSSDVSSIAITSGAPSPLTLSPGAVDSRSLTPQLIVSSPDAETAPELQSPQTTISRPPSIRLPPASISPQSTYSLPFPEEDDERDFVKYRWWPYTHLPPPQIIVATLFPTLYGWRDKSIWDRLLGIVTAPSVFLLTITLPVVEPSRDDALSHLDAGLLSPDIRAARLPQDSPELHARTQSLGAGSHPHGGLSRQNTEPGKLNIEPPQPQASLKAWNRWLVIVQIFTAPLFVALIVWANLDEANGMLLLKFVLVALLLSLICLFILLLTTTAEREPRYRPLFCFLGFAVAIAWISTIANEVVGVLKTIGVVLDISDAILGLTIFAVGNSLGDLVADITVAKLGYPVMALSACFGGPMLNILLGIGIGGLYMTINSSGNSSKHKHHKHSGHAGWKPYRLEVSTTLMISGVALLVTLLGLLIVVPLNSWRMDRKIGIGLIVLWSIATLINVVLEIMGVEGKWDSFVAS